MRPFENLYIIYFNIYFSSVQSISVSSTHRLNESIVKDLCTIDSRPMVRTTNSFSSSFMLFFIFITRVRFLLRSISWTVVVFEKINRMKVKKNDGKQFLPHEFGQETNILWLKLSCNWPHQVLYNSRNLKYVSQAEH